MLLAFSHAARAFRASLCSTDREPHGVEYESEVPTNDGVRTLMDSVIGTAKCCRLWAVLLYTRIGRCGACHERPRLVAADPPWYFDVPAVSDEDAA